MESKKHTLNPVTTGSSVLGLLYDEGVLIVADTKASYGSYARYMNVERLFKVTNSAVVACGGDIGDYQAIRRIVEQKVRDDECGEVTQEIGARSLHCWLTRVFYNRRTKFDPFWLSCIVGGFQDGKPFLGFVDKIGTAYTAGEIATGMGSNLATPIMRAAREKKGNMSRAEAKEVISECMKLLYYRDNTAHFKYHIADVTKDGASIEEINFKQNTDWSLSQQTIVRPIS